MRSYSVAQIKARLSKVLADVVRGEVVVITDHNRAIAKLSTVGSVPLLPKCDPSSIYMSAGVRLHTAARTSTELVRAIRDEEG